MKSFESQPAFETTNAQKDAEPSLISEALRSNEVLLASYEDLRPEIQRIQQEDPELIFPLNDRDMKGLINMYQECRVNGSCLPEEIEGKMIDGLRSIKERKALRQQAA